DHAGGQNHPLVHPLVHARVKAHGLSPLIRDHHFRGRGVRVVGGRHHTRTGNWNPQNARRPSRASASIWLLANSSTEPEGKPRAKRVTHTPVPASRLEMYSAVPSPSRVGLVAMITSCTPPCCTRRSRASAVSCSGPMLSSGASRPCRTWYSPR